MALLDIGAVTRTLMKIIDLSVNLSSDWPAASPALTVSPMPPDKLAGDAVAGLYLYHVTEDAAFKNQPPPSGVTDLRFTPMALDLHYVLTARSGDNDAGTLTEQLIMGLAMKGLRDVPMIDDTTLVHGQPVVDGGMSLRDNYLRIVLHPVPAAEAVSYWTAGSSPLRLSAYYQASVVLLEPDPPPRGAGRVLVYGIQTFTTGTPRLDASTSVLAFQLPGESRPRQVSTQPAQVTQLGAGDPFTLTGSALTGGAATLLLRQVAATTPVVADAAWQLQVTAAGATARAQVSASGTPTPPGLYAASIRVARQSRGPDGAIRATTQVSNEVPLAIAPGISALGTPDATGKFSITGTGFTPADAVVLYLGDVHAQPGNAAALAPGEYAVIGATSLDARLPAGTPSKALVPVRVIVDGSEGPPNWVVAP